jgi:RHS repeat-associated protein
MAKTLPNGIRQEFSYDGASRVTEIAYKRPDSSVIETIGYAYNVNGDRITKTSGGNSKQETAFSAQYDEANRATAITIGDTNEAFALLYDDNGNLVRRVPQAGGQPTDYVWDSRNRLVQIVGPGMAASFEYDALNRRVSKTINGQRIDYIYDGIQAIGEIAAGQLPTALLTGLAVDEAIVRYTETGSHTYLVDALGSVIAQTKADQSVENFYVYSPYGEVATLGADAANDIQFTGRENDQTGLYYYRARYYDPVLKRFVSEDPTGLEDSLNIYAYARGNPLRYIDPTGKFTIVEIAVVVTAVIVGGMIWSQMQQNGANGKKGDDPFGGPSGGSASNSSSNSNSSSSSGSGQSLDECYTECEDDQKVRDALCMSFRYMKDKSKQAQCLRESYEETVRCYTRCRDNCKK